MNRREFIKASGLATGGVMLAPYIISKPLTDDVLGHSSHRYKVVKDWGILDATKVPVNDCHEMVQDKSGRIILLTNETKNNVIVYNKDGKLLDTWGHDYPGAHGLTLWNENGTEYLFICDYERHLVQKVSMDGKVMLTINYPKDTGLYSEEAKFRPTETLVAPNGDIYVADGYGENWILQYNSKGELIRYFGGKGTAENQFQCAHGITLDRRSKGNPELIICERITNNYKRFTLDGKFIRNIPLPGAYLSRPVIKGDYLYGAVLISKLPWDSKSGFVTIVDKHDQCVSNPGGSEPVYKDGKLNTLTQVGNTFMSPHDVLIDDDENLYVAQWASMKTYPIKLERVK